MSLEVARRFGSRTTMTVVESTNYPVYEVAYPAVVVCDNNRVHWDKLLDYERRQLSELDADTRAVFRSLVTSLAQMEWADFDLFTPKDLANYRALDTLSHVNFSDVMKQVMPKCEEFFHNACYWRSETRNCCDIFEVLLTDIGYCFAFNSLFNHMSSSSNCEQSLDQDEEVEQKEYKEDEEMKQKEYKERKCEVSVNEPTALRMDGLIVGSDQMAVVRVSSDVTYTTDTVRSLRPGDRGCLYSNERDALQQGAYSYANCRLECFRQYAIATCACLPYFFPPAGNHNTCTTVQFKCLYDNNVELQGDCSLGEPESFLYVAARYVPITAAVLVDLSLKNDQRYVFTLLKHLFTVIIFHCVTEETFPVVKWLLALTLNMDIENPF
ncbi:pickpocket protein 19-like [Schistocerca americana]|uniref:pickpocket protein 19-like n=1 Tax=Schistocerca americana TaxID=7009 RepID=UPI001F4F68B9|nr:pickpocket protein 19-like [Schistocerca americana]